MRFSDRVSKAPLLLDFSSLVLRPRISDLHPQNISLSLFLKALRLNVPIIAAGMIGTSSVKQCEAIAQVGWLGILPRKDLRALIDDINDIKSARPGGSKATVDHSGRLAIAVTISTDEVPRALQLARAGADVIVLDSAHGARSAFFEAAKELKNALPPSVCVVAGNVVTREAAIALADAGVDAIKVGLGVGSICTVTELTGVGIPQAEAVAEVADAVSQYRIPVIAEGGISSSGDIVKAIACGATLVSLGNVFARAREAGGETVIHEGKRHRVYAANSYPTLSYKKDGKTIELEGIKGLVPIEGSTEEIVRRLESGIRVGFAFCGAKDIQEMQRTAELRRIDLRGEQHLINAVALTAQDDAAVVSTVYHLTSEAVRR
jgi:IMP dehydrogenase